MSDQRPLAGYLQGLGMGLIPGALAALHYGPIVLYPIAGAAIVLGTVAYALEKRSDHDEGDT